LEIPVTIEVEPAKFEVEEGNRQLHRDTEKNVQKFIDMGLRAVLEMQSFITGQLMIELDFHPGSPVNFRSPAGDLIEIPTIPSTTQRLANALQNLDLKGMEKNLTNTLAGIDRLVNNPDLKDSMGELKGVLSDTRRLVQNMNARVGPLADGFDATLQDARKLVQSLDGRVKPLADTVNRTVEDFDQLARDADARLDSLTNSLGKTLAGARGVLSQDAPLIVELEETLKEISDAARSIRQLANTLDQKPEALIQGLGKSGEKLNERCALFPLVTGGPADGSTLFGRLPGQEPIAAVLYAEPDNRRQGHGEERHPGARYAHRHRPDQAGRLPGPLQARHPQRRQPAGESRVRSLGRGPQG
jgi:paraquat-inducible protein B